MFRPPVVFVLPTRWLTTWLGSLLVVLSALNAQSIPPLRPTVTLGDGAPVALLGVLTLNHRNHTVGTNYGMRRLDVGKRQFIARRAGVFGGVAKDGTVAAVSDNEWGVNLVLMDPAGLVIERLEPMFVKKSATGNGDPVSLLQISPDAKRLALYPSQYAGVLAEHPILAPYQLRSNTPSKHMVFLLDARGKVQARFVGYREPAWTPSGEIVMCGAGGHVPHGLYRVHPDRPKVVDRIDGGQLQADVYDPAVAPDGRIAFHFMQQIWVINADGSGLRQLVRDPRYELLYPTWSPDGKAMAYLKRNANEITEGVFFVDFSESPPREHFHSLRRKAADGAVHLFEPWGPMAWTKR